MKFAGSAGLILGVGLVLAGSAMADPGHGHWHGPRVRTHVGIYIDPFWGPWQARPYPSYWYPYYPPPSPVVVVPQSPPVYVEQNPAPAENVWYYCPERQAYYPYVRECPAGWQRVPAQPPAPR